MFDFQRARKRVVCADGFSMSVQGSQNNYCEPRTDGWKTRYSSVEIGFPSEKVEDLMEYMEDLGLDDDADPTDQVYPYVPAVIVCKVIANHGNMVSGEVPNMIVKPPANGEIDNTHDAKESKEEDNDVNSSE